jgi:hypothetical protein
MTVLRRELPPAKGASPPGRSIVGRDVVSFIALCSASQGLPCLDTRSPLVLPPRPPASPQASGRWGCRGVEHSWERRTRRLRSALLFGRRAGLPRLPRELQLDAPTYDSLHFVLWK